MEEKINFFRQHEPGESVETFLNTSEENLEPIASPETTTETFDSHRETIIKSFAQEYLARVYEQVNVEDEKNRQLFSDNDINQQIAHLINDTDYEKGVINPRLQRSLGIFVNELIAFTRDHLGSEEPERAKAFIANVQEIFFSYSPNIISHVGLVNMALLTTKANRIPEIQGWVGGTMVNELVYTLNWSSTESIKEIIEQANRLSLADKLDFIQQFETIGASAAAQGWADTTVSYCRTIIEKLASGSETPFLHYAADIALEELTKEADSPSKGIITFYGNQGDGRRRERLSHDLIKESAAFQARIKPNRPLPPGGELVRIAADSLAICDHSSTPVALARVGTIDFPPSERLTAGILNQLKAMVTRRTINNPEACLTLIDRVNAILLEHQKTAISTSEEKATAWHAISDLLTVNEWKDFFEGAARRDIAIQEFTTRSEELDQKFATETEILIKEINQQIAAADSLHDAAPSDLQDNWKFFKNDPDRYRALFDKDGLRFAASLNDYCVSLAATAPEEPIQQTAKNYLAAYEKAQSAHDALVSQNEQQQQKLQEEMGNSPLNIKAIRDFLLIHHKLSEEGKTFARDLLTYIDTEAAEADKNATPTNFLSYEEMTATAEMNPFAATGEQDLPLLLRHLHDPKLRAAIETDLSIDLRTIPLASQIHLLRFLTTSEQKTLERFKKIMAAEPDYQSAFLESFLVVSEDVSYGELLLELAERDVTPEHGGEIFSGYVSFVIRAQEQATAIEHDLREAYPALTISSASVLQGLLSRGKDYLSELNMSLQKEPTGAPSQIQHLLKELNTESGEEQIVRSHFKRIASLLGQTNIKLENHETAQTLITESLLQDKGKALSFQVLQRMGRLQPISEIHWRVDRSLAEYNRRLGLDVSGFLRERSGSRKQILLEIGPGNGSSKQERAEQGLTNFYSDFALSDKIYYPLDTVIHQALDFSALNEALSSPLSPAEEKVVAEILYKTTVIESGQTGLSNFAYDETSGHALAGDVNALKKLWPAIKQKLAGVTELPSTISSRTEQGAVIYPYQQRLSEMSESVQRAKQLLTDNLTAYLKKDWQTHDYNEYISGFPANTLLGDISDISRLADNQIDVELAVRSTVYSRGEDYVHFLKDLSTKLRDGGVAIDDSIRDNDGWYYRFAEVTEALGQIKEKLEVMVVLGPGFPGEDYRSDRVPLAMVITKKGSSKKAIEQYLEPGNACLPLEQLLHDEAYLASLDRTGLTQTRAQAATK